MKFRISFSIKQFALMADFCNDLAKGFVISFALGSFLADSITVQTKVVFFMIGIVLGLLFLGLALQFNKLADATHQKGN